MYYIKNVHLKRNVQCVANKNWFKNIILYNNYKIKMAEVKREYYNSGELRYEVIVINDIKNGLYKEYFENGQLAEMHTYIDNKLNGEYESYYRNGKLSCKCTYIDDKLNGEYKSYCDNGKLFCTCTYIDGKEYNKIIHTQ